MFHDESETDPHRVFANGEDGHQFYFAQPVPITHVRSCYFIQKLEGEKASKNKIQETGHHLALFYIYIIF